MHAGRGWRHRDASRQARGASKPRRVRREACAVAHMPSHPVHPVPVPTPLTASHADPPSLTSFSPHEHAQRGALRSDSHLQAAAKGIEVNGLLARPDHDRVVCGFRQKGRHGRSDQADAAMALPSADGFVQCLVLWDEPQSPMVQDSDVRVQLLRDESPMVEFACTPATVMGL